MWRQVIAVILVLVSVGGLVAFALFESGQEAQAREVLNAGMVRIEGGITGLSTRLTGVETSTSAAKSASEGVVASVADLKTEVSIRLKGVEQETRQLSSDLQGSESRIADAEGRLASRISKEHGVLEQHAVELANQAAALTAKMEGILVALEKIRAIETDPALLEEIQRVRVQLGALQWGAVSNQGDLRVLQIQISSAQEWLEALLERADLFHTTKGE